MGLGRTMHGIIAYILLSYYAPDLTINRLTAGLDELHCFMNFSRKVCDDGNFLQLVKLIHAIRKIFESRSPCPPWGPKSGSKSASGNTFTDSGYLSNSPPLLNINRWLELEFQK